MKLIKHTLGYLLAVLAASAVIALVIHSGADLTPHAPQPVANVPAAAAATDHATVATAGPFDALKASASHPLSRLFVQLLVIIAAARLAGSAFTRIGLPAVVGEMTAALFDDLERRHPGLRFRVVDEQQRLRPNMRLFPNGLGVRDLGHALNPDDGVAIVLALSGG